MSDNNQIPESVQMDKLFENYLRCHIFIKKYFVQLDKIHDFHASPDEVAGSSNHSEFKMRDKTNRIFYLEARFCVSAQQDKINWCNADDLKRYQELDKTHPVFVVIGTGGQPDFPKNLFVIPINDVSHTDLSMSALMKHHVALGKPIIPEDLWSQIQVKYRQAS